MKRTRIFRKVGVMLALLIIILSTPRMPTYGSSPSPWAAESVDRAISLGIVPKSLRADYTKPATRQEFCAMAAAFLEHIQRKEIAERREFSDSDDVNVQKMGGLGIVTGTADELFLPDHEINREQVAVFLVKIIMETDIPLKAAPYAYTDNEDISSWALDAVSQVSGAGLMNGTEDDVFLPKEEYTIEQVIVSLMRIRELAEAARKEENAEQSEYTEKVLKLMNAEREKMGLKPLKGTNSLYAAAAIRAREQEELFSHQRPGDKPWYSIADEFVLPHTKIGENLGKNYKTPERLIAGLMNSADHRKNILDPDYKKTGVAVYLDQYGMIYCAILYTD